MAPMFDIVRMDGSVLQSRRPRAYIRNRTNVHFLKAEVPMETEKQRSVGAVLHSAALDDAIVWLA